MTPVAFIAELTRRGIQLGVQNEELRFRPGSAATPEIRALLREHKAELLAALAVRRSVWPSTRTMHEGLASHEARSWPLVEDGRLVRWRKSDEWGCQKCKHCGGPFIWAQVVADTDPKAKRRAFFKLDPDLGFHGCGGPRAGRFTYEEGQPTHRGTNP